MTSLKHKNFLKRELQILFLIGVVILAVWLGLLARENIFIQGVVSSYGYGGVFLVSIISGFNIVVPVPTAAFFPLFAVSGLNPWLTVFVIAVGVTLADAASYFVGKFGRRLVPLSTEKTIVRMEKLRNRVHYLPLIVLFFFAAFIPFPNEVLIIPMAFLGYRMRHLLLPVSLGNATFNTLAMLGTLNLFKLL
ncbi:MAG: hypothetical protein BMS9Abin13_273 [Patescibacteria group bacterium]|nr:MAG: hypothetical protein BMS9Abin13_273 [Patescibacteria group bacterium]